MPAAALQLWRALQEDDGHLPDLDQFGAGELVGGHLRVKFVRDQEGQLFGCEVADQRRGRIWEAGFAQTGRSDFRAFWRDVAAKPAEPEEWREATNALTLIPHTPRLEPTFQALVTAHAATGGMTLGENVLTRAALDDDLAYWRDLTRAQAAVIRRLNERLSVAREIDAASSESTAPEPTREWGLRELGEWAALNADRIVVLPRAIAAARKANYQDEALIFAALEVLAGPFRDVKSGKAPRDQARDELLALGVSMGGSVEPSIAGDEYVVRWRGRRRFLDQHLKKGTSRDPRFAMRIYYTWDDELGVCVVGSLPNHLTNSLS